MTDTDDTQNDADREIVRALFGKPTEDEAGAEIPPPMTDLEPRPRGLFA